MSLTASPENVPYYTVEDGDPTPVGGTSAATPSFAGILALVTQAVVTNGGPLGLGDVNPQLYALARSNPEAFHDIVAGDNNSPCLASDMADYPDCPAAGSYGGYKAGTGYDLGSGLGSVDAANLVAAWSVQANTAVTVAASATTASVDTPVTLSAHVSSAGTVTTAILTGSVTFNFQTYSGSAGAVYAGADGGFDESWTLGTATVNGTATGADVTLSTRIPPGLFGKAYVVAQYSGDAKHLASVSAQTEITVTGATLAIAPTTLTLRPNEQTTFSATGGAPPVLWFVEAPDPTCVVDTTTGEASCSQIESEDEVTGFFQAGPARRNGARDRGRHARRGDAGHGHRRRHRGRRGRSSPRSTPDRPVDRETRPCRSRRRSSSWTPESPRPPTQACRTPATTPARAAAKATTRAAARSARTAAATPDRAAGRCSRSSGSASRSGHRRRRR